MPIHNKFKCPLSGEIMTKPVTIQCGHVFEFTNIINHCANQLDRSKQPECPCCHNKLAIPLQYKPNDVLLRQINKYLSRHPEYKERFSSIELANSDDGNLQLMSQTRGLFFRSTSARHQTPKLFAAINYIFRILPKI